MRIPTLTAATALVAHAAPALTTFGPLRNRLLPGLAAVGDPHHVALTFDDGPDPASTPLFLDVLRDRDVRATFFLLGSMAERAPGLVDEIKVAGGQVMAQFQAGRDGRAIAISPDGAALYVLKGTLRVSNIAVMDVATESVRRVLPAPSYCRGLLVSPSGDQLYEVVGTSGYGNIQVFAL